MTFVILSLFPLLAFWNELSPGQSTSGSPSASWRIFISWRKQSTFLVHVKYISHQCCLRLDFLDFVWNKCFARQTEDCLGCPSFMLQWRREGSSLAGIRVDTARFLKRIHSEGKLAMTSQDVRDVSQMLPLSFSCLWFLPFTVDLLFSSPHLLLMEEALVSLLLPLYVIT